MQPQTRAFHARNPLTWLLVAAAGVFLALGLRAIVDPVGASAFFGAPVADGEGLAFVQAFGARNAALAIVALLLIYQDLPRILGALLFLSSLIACVDAASIVLHHGAPVLNKHVAYVVVLAGLAAYVVRRATPTSETRRS